MEIFTTLKHPIASDSAKISSIALGFFDGVHIAHKKILESAVNLAKSEGADKKSAVITFKRSPGGYFDPNKGISIQAFEDKIKMFEALGIDIAYVLDFEEYKNIEADEYLMLLVKQFAPKYIITGFNHTFGKKEDSKTQGDSVFLRAHQNLGYKYVEIEKMRLNNTLISSTNIKKFIERAYIKEANTLLGYDFYIKGTVIKGMGLARKLGFNTANIKWPDNIVKPPYGVYFGGVELNNIQYNALINWGVKPTVDDKNEPVLEAHILNFNEDIYGKEIKVSLKKPIREEKKFNNIEELKFAISDDINFVNQELKM